ncbi:MAG: hypothetical protein JHC93_03955 [Parachlamydiales bacterium]|nr:hypothetical protein [Parachlamydiales bacterium]
MLTPETLAQVLQEYTGFKFDFMLNDNRTCMISMKGNRFFKKRLSIHRMFLQAPDDVLQAVARFLKKRDKKSNRIINVFIQNQSSHLDHTPKVKKITIKTTGVLYDLQAIYDEINQYYFDKKLDLKITWSKPGRGLNHIVFGRYFDTLKLIRINQMMDDPFFPYEFVSLVVYHEMLHHVVPSYYDQKGHFRQHGPVFKAEEKKFKQYSFCQKWLRANKKEIFNRQKAQ